STHFFSTVLAFAETVVLVSAFMARSLTEMDEANGDAAARNKPRRPIPEGTQRRFGAGQWRWTSRKSSRERLC
ncbi:hypothetical protein LC608_35130, partial [Nostoc sp. XA010]|nr:hypothetical protein [Nostoc sp. XA010]